MLCSRPLFSYTKAKSHTFNRGDFAMQKIQEDVICALLRHIYGLGLISKYTYSTAEDLVHSMADLPEFFKYPVCFAKEDSANECT